MSTRVGSPQKVRAATKADGNGRSAIDLDMDSVTLDDIEAVETLLGRPCLQEFSDRRLLTISVIRALITVTQRKTNPGFSVADAGKIRLVELNPVSKSAANPTQAVSDAR